MIWRLSIGFWSCAPSRAKTSLRGTVRQTRNWALVGGIRSLRPRLGRRAGRPCSGSAFFVWAGSGSSSWRRIHGDELRPLLRRPIRRQQPVLRQCCRLWCLAARGSDRHRLAVGRGVSLRGVWVSRRVDILQLHALRIRPGDLWADERTDDLSDELECVVLGRGTAC